MLREEFDRAIKSALDLAGRRVPTDTQLSYAWRELGQGSSDAVIRCALRHLAYSRETNLPAAVEQARIHAYQQRKVERVEVAGCCDTCEGKRWHYMQTLRKHAVWHTGGVRQVDTLDQPTVCRVAYRCPSCNGGRVQPRVLRESECYDEMTQTVTQTPTKNERLGDGVTHESGQGHDEMFKS